MRKIKKFVSILMVLCMVFSLTTSISAANSGTTTGSITISNATIGQRYYAYRLFEATYDSTGATAYIATAAQKATLEADADNVFAFTDLNDGTYQVTIATDPATGSAYTNSEVVAFIKSYAVTLSGGVVACNFPGATLQTGTSNTGIADNVATASTVVINNVPLGYYFVTSSLGATISLSTTAPNASIEDKNTGEPDWDNDEPEIDDPIKDVLDSNGTSIDGEKVLVNATLTYQISYTNDSEIDGVGVDLDEVKVYDAAPDGTEYVAGSIAIQVLDSAQNDITSTLTTTTDDANGYPNGALTWTVEDLPYGATLIATFNVTVLSSALNLTNKTVVNGADVDVTYGDHTYDLETNIVENPVGEEGEPVKTVTDESKLEIVGNVKPGDVLTYEITYTVPQPDSGNTISYVIITDAPPTGTMYVVGSAAGTLNGNAISADCISIATDGTITWNLTNLTAGDEIAVSFRVTVTEEALTITDSTVLNQATVVIPDHEYTTNVVQTPVETEEDEPEIDEPVKDVLDSNGTSIDGEKVQVADVLTYQISYTNNSEVDGSGVVLNEVKVYDAAPDGTEYVSGSIAIQVLDSTQNDITSTLTTVTDDTNGLTWTVEDLPYGATLIATFDVTVLSSALQLTNKTVENGADVDVTYGEHVYELETNIVENPVDEGGTPDKEVKDNTGESINKDAVKVGDILTYEITYTVPYPAAGETLSTLTIVDAPPTGTAYVEGTAAGTVNGTAIASDHIDVATDGTITWTVNDGTGNDITLTGGETVVVTFKVVVTQDALTEETVDNQAVVKIGDNEYYTNIVKNPVPGEEEEFGKVIVNDDGTLTTVSTGAFGDTVTFDVSIDAVNSVANDAGTDANNDGVVDPVQVSAYYIYDKMASGLTLDEDSFTFTIGATTYAVEEDKTQTYTDVTVYIATTVDANSNTVTVATIYVSTDSEGCTIIAATIPWVDADKNALYANCEVHLTYSATINTSANIAGTGNLNRSLHDYSTVDNTDPEEPDPDDPKYPDPTSGSDLNHVTEEVITTTYTYALGIQKINETTGEALEGAQFSAVDAGGNAIWAVPVLDSDNNISYYNYTSDSSVSGATSAFTTNADGQVIIRGVDIGTYTFNETKAPNGYVLSDEDYVVTAQMDSSSTTYNTTSITWTRYFEEVTESEWDSIETVYTADSGKFTEAVKPSTYTAGYYKLVDSTTATSSAQTETTTYTFDVNATSMVIENAVGNMLPSTGGIGTTIFYVAGTLLILCAAVLLIVRRRMKKA
ncbi:MAG: isopeptide-forming domain-containing fimbrial protein [Lachnospiraceae bacterium]|nr:isopeptide-forming domain-containing fimbrial protein [Lachnospiraceae bacterium]